MHVKPVILCGGSGTRLWPMSREVLPKQFLPLLSNDSTLLQDTILRAQAVSAGAEAIVVCNEEHRFLVADQLAAIGASALQMLEPEGRNTAAAVAVAAIATEEEDPVLLVLSSDHAIGNLPAFNDAVARAVRLAMDGYLVTFGLIPTRPETGFGYIQRGQAVEGVFNAYRVDGFVEKPPENQAKALIAGGCSLWNSGMFAFRSSVIIEELRRFRPELLGSARAAVTSASRDLGFMRLGRQAFLECHSEPIDRAVMELTRRAAVVTAEFTWSDVGSWAALWEIADKDDAGNAIRGDVRPYDTKDCLVFSNHRLVSTLGVSDLIVVETSDAVLVADRSRSQEVREVVEDLRGTDRTEHITHTRVYRPWGYFENLDAGPGYLVKRIMVKPGAALSLQMHHYRAEHWVVVSGVARVTRGTEIMLLERNQSIYIPLAESHRLENPGQVALHLIEVQSGDLISEEDIVRFDDRYER